MQVIRFPDVEAVIVSYLNAQLTAFSETARASTKTTNANKFVTVRRTGGNAVFVVDNARVTFEAWATTEAVAANLAQLVRGIILAADQITYQGTTYQTYEPQELAAPANNPDPDSAASYARYTWTAQIGFRGTAIN